MNKTTKARTPKAKKSLQSMGGTAVFKKYGSEHMSKLQKKRWALWRKEQSKK